jgi:NAD(P)H-flavin reductase
MSCHARAWSRETVISNRSLVPGCFELVTSWYGPEPEPGQFFMLRASRSGVLLGRPLSAYDSSVGRLSFVVAARGPGTRELGELYVGEGVMVEGPLGSAWARSSLIESLLGGDAREPGVASLTADSTAVDLALGTDGDVGGVDVIDGFEGRQSRRLALVGGGIGLAPLFFLARRLPLGSYHLFAGYKSASWGLVDFEPEAVRVFTEDGSEGRRGRVLDGFDATGYSAIVACGPEPMLRGVAALATAAGIPAWISLETRMACGVGACLGCTVRTTKGNRRACVEGPVFPAEEVIFDA